MPDSTLANLTAATAATGGLFYGTQSGVDKKFTSTAAGAALIEAADVAAQQSLLSVLPLSGGTLTGTLTGTTFVGALTGTASGNLVAGGALGTPSSGTLTNCTNIPAANLTGTIDTARLPATITGLTSVTSTTFVGALTGTASGNLVAGGALGTPSSGTLTSCTGLPLSTGVTGDLPLANLAQSSAASKLLGRGSESGAGDFQEITIGSGLSMSGTTLSASGGGGGGSSNVWIPASAWIPKTTAGCGVDSVETTTNDQNFDQLLFDAGTDEFADALVILPNNYNNGSITARFYWTASSGSGDVIWAIQGRAFANDDALDTAAGTAQTVTDTLIAANDMHVSSATSACTIGGTPAANTPVQLTIYRDANAGGDTLGADARLLGVEILYTTA